MKQGHIKITLEDIDTKNVAIFEMNSNNKSAHFDLDNFDPDKGGDAFGEYFVTILDMLGMREKFMKQVEQLKDDN